MRIVIDTNRIIAALIKDSTSRNILCSPKFSFFAPEFSRSEINKYERVIRNKTNLAHEEFNHLLSLLFEHITILPSSTYHLFLKKCTAYISDVDDVPFLAAALAINADGIWTEDKDFDQQNAVRVWKSVDLLDYV